MIHSIRLERNHLVSGFPFPVRLLIFVTNSRNFYRHPFVAHVPYTLIFPFCFVPMLPYGPQIPRTHPSPCYPYVSYMVPAAILSGFCALLTDDWYKLSKYSLICTIPP